MAAIPRQLYTEAEYLALERQSAYKNEYDQGEISVILGASSEHNLIAGNLKTYLHRTLRDKSCRMYLLDID